MPEELRPVTAFGVQGEYENIWHIASAARWSDGRLVGYRTFCGRNYGETAEQRDVEGLPQVCSDCTAQQERPH